MPIEFTDADGDVVEVFADIGAACAHVRRWYGEPVLGHPLPHYPEGFAQTVDAEGAGPLGFFVTVGADE